MSADRAKPPAKLIHAILPVGMLQCNCSILGDPTTGDAIVIDPGDEVDRIVEILRRHNLKVRAIVSTHTHIDHVGGLPALHRSTGAPVLIHEADLALYRSLDQQAGMIGIPMPEMMQIKDFVKEGDNLRWGGYHAQVLHTPGHTPGSSTVFPSGRAAFASGVRANRRAPHRRRHAVPGLYRPHRFPRRFLSTDHRVDPRKASDATRRASRNPRSRRVDDNRPRARVQPIPALTRGAHGGESSLY